jgi:hypothetical protein
MTRRLARAAVCSLVGALAGALAAELAFTSHPTLTLEMQHELPAMAAGFYPPEHIGETAFAWTSSRADLSLPGFDRTSEWTCALSYRGARSADRPQPFVQIAVDGVVVARQTATNDYQQLAAILPTSTRPGVLLSIATAPTFVPGPADRRELGIQVQRLTCRPGGRFAVAPRPLLAGVAGSTAVFGATLVALGLTMPSAIAGTLLVGAVQGIALSEGFAPYSPFPVTVPWMAFWIGLVSVGGAWLLTRWRRQPLRQTARLAIALSAGALLLELVALLHPNKAMADAVFHAHRLEWVLGGRFYFTQPMPNGVNFPYAIALYLAAAPWSFLTRDYVALLKIVVSVARALAGLALYPMTAQAWSDRHIALLAVAIFHLVPLAFLVIGFANLTFAFGQSISALTLAALATYSVGGGGWRPTVGLFVLASVAFLSHVGIFPVLVAIMCVVAALYRWVGGVELKSASPQIVLVTVLAAVFSIAVYYGHFPESYRTLQRVRQQGAIAAAENTPAPRTDAPRAPTDTARSVPVRSVGERIVRAANIAVASFGWPIMLLAAVGAITLWTARARDPMTLLAAACVIVYAGFVGFSAASPVEPRFQRYSEEFISRVNLAVMPVPVVLAARGAVWSWHRNLGTRVVAIGTLAAALVGASSAWWAWLH